MYIQEGIFEIIFANLDMCSLIKIICMLQPIVLFENDNWGVRIEEFPCYVFLISTQNMAGCLRELHVS